MASKVKAALSDRPSRPLTIYFQFRMDKIKELEKQGIQKDGIMKRVNKIYKTLTKTEKEELESDFQKRVTKYQRENTKWMNKHGLTEEHIS